jgi:outer membrane PBP1 activator LpoA protein
MHHFFSLLKGLKLPLSEQSDQNAAPRKQILAIVPDAARPAIHTGKVSYWRSLTFSFLTFWLASCSSNLPYPDGQASFPEVIDSDGALGHPPKGLQALDDLLLQASLEHDLNGLVSASLATQLIDAASREQRDEIAQGILNTTDTSTMSIDEYARFSLAATQYWNNTSQFESAYRWLHSSIFQSQLPMMSAEDQIDLSLERSETLYGLAQYAASAMERIFLEALIDDPVLQQSNADKIWLALLQLDPEILRQQYQLAKNNSYKAWLELAIVQQNIEIDVATQAAQIKQWQLRWPNHAAAQQLPPSVRAFETVAKTQPNSVGVFLPLSGPLSKASQSIRDGVAAAHFAAIARNESTPMLTFYDTSSQSIDELYARAQQDDIDLIIGPLHKDNVKALFTMPSDIPILTLNVIADDLPPPLNIVQFGLSADDEAHQLATFAHQQRYKNILLLHVDKGWAERAAQEFTQQWRAQGGGSLSRQALSSDGSYSREIANSLALNQSEARHSRLQNVLGQRLEFMPRRRQDIDCIVLFANSQQAKAIKPLLAYHYAGQLPVLSSSQVFDGGVAGSSNRDLNGLIFSEIPWVLNSSENYQPLPTIYRENKSLNRLFAMGVDAYYLHGRLNQLSSNPSSQIPANTGKLSIVDHRIVRQLPLAKFQNGKAVPLSVNSLLN